MREFRQREWPDYKFYRIEEKGVFAELKIHGKLTSRLVKFDEFVSETSIYSEAPNPWAIGFFFSFFFNIILGLLMVLENFELSNSIASIIFTSAAVSLCLIGLQVFKFSKEKRINGYDIYLPFDYKKDAEKVDKFIESIFEARRNFLRNKFMKVDEVTPSFTLEANFHMLYESELISEREFLMLQQKLEERKIIKGN